MAFKKEFEKLLAETSISSESSNEEYCAVWKRINELLHPNIPQQLFRFRTCNLENFMTFQNGEISTCVANAFSDKYDSLVYVNKRELEEKLREFTQFDTLLSIINNEEFCGFLTALIGKECIEQARKEAMLYSKEEWTERNAYKVEQVIEHVFIQINTNINNVRNDPFNRVACFSEDITMPHMWDTYANGHKGFALEYDFRDFHNRGCWVCSENLICKNTKRNYSHLFPVIYTNKRYDATDNVISLVLRSLLLNWGFDKCLPIDQLYWYKPYLYKNAKSYAHEKEWRLLSHCPIHDTSKYANIPDCGTLKAIYYGADIEKRHKDFLHEVAKGKKIQEYEMYIDPYSPNFEINIRPYE